MKYPWEDDTPAARARGLCAALLREAEDLANEQRIASAWALHLAEGIDPDVPFWQMDETELYGCLTASRPGPRPRGHSAR